MKRPFCDKCDKEIVGSNAPICNGQPLTIVGLVRRPNFTITLSTHRSDGGKDDTADLCKYCVLDAVAQWDDRPTCGPDYRRLHEILNDTERSVGTRAELIQALRNEFP